MGLRIGAAPQYAVTLMYYESWLCLLGLPCREHQSLAEQLFPTDLGAQRYCCGLGVHESSLLIDVYPADATLTAPAGGDIWLLDKICKQSVSATSAAYSAPFWRARIRATQRGEHDGGDMLVYGMSAEAKSCCYI